MKIYLIILLFFYYSATAIDFTIGVGTDDCVSTQPSLASPTTNASGGSLYYVGGNGITGEVSYLVFFPTLADSLDGNTVTAATLYLDNGGDNATDAMEISIRGLRREFVYNEATWTIAQTGDNWGTLGAKNTTNDVYANVEDTRSADDYIPTGWYEFDVTTYLQLCDGASSANYKGFICYVSTVEDANIIGINTENAAEAVRPKLDVTYTEGEGEATPRRRKIELEN